MPPEIRVCQHPHCQRPFTTTHPHRRYCHPSHRPPKGTHYTPEEKRARRTLFATPPNDTPCPRCEHPMTNEQWAAHKLVSGHVVDKVLGGANMGLRYEHASCGASAGATLGNLLRRTPRRMPAW